MDSKNSTQLSDSIKYEMSYLYPRDPSILAYGQRPFPSQESKKNLFSLLEEGQDDADSTEIREKSSTSTISTNITDTTINQTIKVFLRMKPFPSKLKLTQDQMEAYTIMNSTTLLTKMPSSDTNTSCLKKIKANEMVCRKFIFTQTFDAETSQLELFEQAVKPQMIDFLSGKNSIVMSYGTTNSGKTYTLQGTPESPGIIPRGIEFVFSHINPRSTPCYKPINLCDVVYLNSQDRNYELDSKLKLLSLNPADKCYVATYNQMQQLFYQESPMQPSRSDNAQYSVWISFAEIYNETIYDLLRNDCQKKRPALKLATDSCGRTFIKGLKSICVSSGAEAYQVLMAGQYNLKVAATALNSRSSRSHCIFTIKLLKYTNELDPYSVDVSIFAFCDLAGSERLKKTLNVGERLKEAQNINTSLLVLGRCLKTIYESQNSKQKNESIGPFRESKLTRLFQRALSGKEQLALIVNVNPVPNLYVETQNVLNFSAIAKKIVLQRPTGFPKRRRSCSRFSRLVTQSMKTEMDWENTELDDVTESPECTEEESDIEENDQEYQELLMENEILKKEIKELKASALTKEMQTRQEMTDVYSEIMKKLEADYKNRLTDMEEQQEDLRELAVEQIESYYKDKLNQMCARKRSRSSMFDEDEDDDKKYLQDLEAENTKLTTKLETMKKSMRSFKQMKEIAETEKTKLSFELAVAKEEVKRTKEMLVIAQESLAGGDNASSTYIEKLLETIESKDERIKTMKTFLNEAKEEYINITSQVQKLENEVKEQEELLAENNEHIRDLEEQLNQANAYSSEQSKVIESLEEELEQQTKKLIEAEEKLKRQSEKILALSKSNNENAEITNQINNNEELEKTKLFVDEMKLRLEFSETENNRLKDKLQEKIEEIESLTKNLDSTKSQLDKITDKVSNLSIDNSCSEKSKQKICDTLEQGIQVEIDSSSGKEPLESANTSCQTTEIENYAIETDEKCQQTSFCLNQSEDKEEIINEKNLVIEANKQALDDLEKKYNEIKNILENDKLEKVDAQKQFEESSKDLQNQIIKLTEQIKEKDEQISVMQKELDELHNKSQDEVTNLKDLINLESEKCKNLMSQITAALDREQDKDKEILSLQKEMKILIRSNDEVVQKMEVEMKKVLSELTSVKDKLVAAEEQRFKMDTDYKQVIQILEKQLEQTSLDKQLETDKLKLRIEELKNALDHSEHELEVFKRNRDETVSKYEDLVKSQYDEIEHLKKEVTRLQDLLQEVKENAVNIAVKGSARKQTRRKPAKTNNVYYTSEEEHAEDSQSEKQKSRKTFLTPSVDNVPVVELSGSESKKYGKTAVSNQPTSVRVTRRKKLFTPLDESYIDIEPGDDRQPSPSPNTNARSLRNRRR